MYGSINYNTILETYKFLRENNSSIPDETLDFMKDAALEKLMGIERFKYWRGQECQCGHLYYEHFNLWDEKFVGCKHCGCKEFIVKE